MTRAVQLHTTAHVAAFERKSRVAVIVGVAALGFVYLGNGAILLALATGVGILAMLYLQRSTNRLGCQLHLDDLDHAQPPPRQGDDA